MFDRLGHLVSSYPRWILGFWLVLVLICLPLAARVGEVLVTDPGAAPNNPASEVFRILSREFSEPTGLQLLLIGETRAAELDNTDAAFVSAFDRVVSRIRELDAVETVTDSLSDATLPLRTPDGRALLALVRLSVADLTTAQEITAGIRAGFPTDGPLAFYLAGGPAVEQELLEISERDTRRAELVSLPGSLIVLGVAFGAVVAAGLPLVVAVVSIVLSLAALFILGQGFPVATFAQIIVSMLGLTTGIDYALVMVHRFREELGHGVTARVAAATTAATAGRAVVFSGSTVMIALLALLIPPLPFVRSMGIAGVTVMFVGITVAITALPASLALLGTRVNGLRLSKRQPGQRTRAFWRARAAFVMARPRLWIAIGITTLLALTAPALDMQVAFSRVQGLVGDSGTKRAQRLLEEAGLAGLLRSFDVLVDFGDRGFYHPQSVRRVSQLARSSAALTGVKQVVGATTTPLPALLTQQYYASADLARASPLADLVDATVSRDGRYALVRVFPEATLSPRDNRALQRSLQASATELGLNAQIGGQIVSDAAWAGALYGHLPLTIGVVVMATFVVLGVAFRSIVVPLKAIVLNTFTIGAACGVVTLIFQHGWAASLFGLEGGLGFVETIVPLFLFTLVFGLSMDYEVFVVSRLYEAHQRGMNSQEAVLHAVGATGSIITSAALIMLTVFVSFAFSGIVLVKALSVGLVVAVVLDATLVRFTLVPAILSLAGHWNWWLPPPVAHLVGQKKPHRDGGAPG